MDTVDLNNVATCNYRSGNSKVFNANPLKAGTLKECYILEQLCHSVGFILDDKSLAFYSAIFITFRGRHVSVSTSTLQHTFATKIVSSRALKGFKDYEPLIDGGVSLEDKGACDAITVSCKLVRQEPKKLAEIKHSDDYKTLHSVDLKDRFTYISDDSDLTENDISELPEFPSVNLSYDYWAVKAPKLYAEFCVREDKRLFEKYGYHLNENIMKLADTKLLEAEKPKPLTAAQKKKLADKEKKDAEKADAKK